MVRLKLGTQLGLKQNAPNNGGVLNIEISDRLFSDQLSFFADT